MTFFRILMISIILFFGNDLHGQPPGYLGKRLFVEGNIGRFSGISESTYISRLGDEPDLNNLTTVFALGSINWVTKRYNYLALEMDYRQFSETAAPLESFPGQPELEYRVKLKTIGLAYYRTFRKKGRSIAPLGRFIGWKLYYTQTFAIPIKYAGTDDKFEGVERAAYDLKYETPSLGYLGAALNFGRRTILQDRITLNYMVSLGYNFAYEFESDISQTYALKPYELDRYKAYFANISIGAGVLLF